MVETIITKFKSLFYKKNETKAMEILKDKNKVSKLLEEAMNKAKANRIGPIDEIWSKTELYSDRLDTLAEQSDNTLDLVHINQSHIDELSKYKEELCSIKYLREVDKLWNSNEMHSNQLSKLEKQSKETNNFIQNNKKLIDSALADMAVKNDIAVQALTKKIKYAYLLTGGSLGLALIELVVIFLKVM